MNPRRRQYLRPRKHLVFNCTEELPYSAMAVTRYIQAVGGMEPGTFNRITVRHDSESGQPCANCGRVTP